MGNITIAIKRFLKNKNTVTIFAILAALGILYAAYYLRIQKATEPVSVPYATKQLAPRTLITSEMISVKKVPGGIVSTNVITSTDDIIGKYVSNDAVIPNGGLFYSSMVKKWEELPSSVFEDIPDNQTVYALPVDSEKTYGNSIFPGNYIDLYFRASVDENNQNKVWIGRFIKSIRVLAVTDQDGKSVFETDEKPGEPAYLLFNVPDDVFRLLMKIELIGYNIELFPVQRNAKYSKEPEPTTIVGTEFQMLVESYAVDDSIILSNNNNKKFGGAN